MNPIQVVLCVLKNNGYMANHSSIIKNQLFLIHFWFFCQRIISLFTAVSLGLIIPGLVSATDLTVFGPETLVRGSGNPVVVEHTFNVNNPLVAHTLQITNGGLQDDTSTTEYVSSSKIYLNGVLIVGPQNFNQNVQSLSIPVTLQVSNTLSVELRGKPGGQMAIVIVRDQNTQPAANAGTDQTVYVGDTAQLDGSSSTDTDGDLLTYFWELIETPAQSQTLLNNPSEINPTLLIDSAGRYTLDLVVNDGFEDSIADQLIIDTLNSAPVADAGDDQTAFVNGSVTLDGSNSQDVDDDFLNYQWRLAQQPTGSQSILENANTAVADLTIDQPGQYIAELIVNDGELDSAPDQVAINTLNSAPVASAGLDQAAFVGDEVILDGIDSYDVDGDTLSYHWALLNKPTGSAVALIDSDAVQSRFTPDVAGLYVAQLIVQDLELPSEPKTTMVTVTVKPVNHSPAILSTANTTATTGETYSYAVTAEDQDGDLLSYRLAAALAEMTINSAGQITWTAQASGTYAVIVEVTDGRGGLVEQSFSIVVIDPVDNSLPPDPVTVAPELNSTEFTELADSTAFLYTGDNPIQTGVATGTIEAARVAIIRGKVLNDDNQALTGVIISVKDHPEFGQTLSRADGVFDMAVNGGGLLTINYTKMGYLPVQRQVQTPWADYAYAEDIVMIPLDDKATLVDLSNNTAAFQVAQGSVNTDIDGSRQATVLFPQGTTATMILPDGTTQPLTSMTVRATEYTVGENGPKRMPGPLPPTSAYTYAVELSVDEAIAVDATTVSFNQAVPVYVDNFLNFSVGEVVPVGYYDNSKTAWIPSENGKVIKILSITNGQANLDVDGDTLADTGTKLTDLGITDAERIELATLYEAGKSLWRFSVKHLTPWDCNWPFGPPSDAAFPPNQDKDQEPDDDCEETGCVIQIESQVLGEDYPITGSEFSLHYRSNRVPGRKTGQKVTIPLSGNSIPDSLIGIKLTINVAGQTFTESFPAAINQTTEFIWNGQDAFGRDINKATAAIQVEFIYPLQYYPARSDLLASFAVPGVSTGDFIGFRGASTVNTVRAWNKIVQNNNIHPIANAGVGTLSLNVHHAYSTRAHTLFKGDGSHVPTSRLLGSGIYTIAGNGDSGFSGDGGVATETQLNSPWDVAVDAKGNQFFSDHYNNRIRKINAEGIITTVAGNGNWEYSGDGGLATETALNDPQGIAIDASGNLFIAEFWGHRIRKVSPDGVITTVAGNGEDGFSGDGGLATQAQLGFLTDVDVDAAGNLYIADDTNHRIRKVSPDGIITTVVGNGSSVFSGDGGLATDAGLPRPGSITVDDSGNLYVTDWVNGRIRKITTDGTITTVAGNGSRTFSGDGGLATDAGFSAPQGTAVDKVGNLYIADFGHSRIRKVSPDGIITSVAGNGEWGFANDGDLATNSPLNSPGGITLDAAGNLLIAGLWDNKVYYLSSFAQFSTSATDLVVPSKDGNEIYIFDTTGRHLETRNALTNTTIYSFAYEQNELLSTITDVDGRVTTIERLADGMPVAIVTPDGERTVITLNSEGFVKQLINPAGESHQMSFLPGGLLDIYTDPNGNS